MKKVSRVSPFICYGINFKRPFRGGLLISRKLVLGLLLVSFILTTIWLIIFSQILVKPKFAHPPSTNLQLVKNYVAAHSGIPDNIIEKSTANIPTPPGNYGWCVAMKPHSALFVSQSNKNQLQVTGISNHLNNSVRLNQQKMGSTIHYLFHAVFFLYFDHNSTPPVTPTQQNPLYMAKNSFYLWRNDCQTKVVCDSYASYSNQVFSWIAFQEMVSSHTIH